MASNALGDIPNIYRDDRTAGAGFGAIVLKLLKPLASLRLTVVLFALAIFLVLAGTLAQVERDIWEVMDLYFRRWVAYVPLQIFFPKQFFPNLPPVPGGFYFPGGFLIGGAMALNLAAAHGVRFKTQAHGQRLMAGLAVITIGAVLTVLVILGGSDKSLVESGTNVNTGALWLAAKLAISALWLIIAYGLWSIDSELRLQRWLLMALGLIVGGVVAALWVLPQDTMPDPAGMRILWQLVKATGATAVLLSGCALLFRKRAGIVLLHAGVGLMMVNELVVYSLHAEGVMQLAEGEKANYVQDIRSLELAIVDPADSEVDDVTVIPKKLLEGGELIADAHLPFDVQVTRYYPNSALRVARPDEKNPATAGAGLKAVPEPRAQGSGVQSDKEVDLAAAYVKLLEKGTDKPLGTWLVTIGIDPQPVEVDGKRYEIALRFKRDYKPYSVELMDVRKDDYVGTDTPRNYSSDVRVVDSAVGFDHQFHIWMNNPLRYSGETFYQSNYAATPRGEVTTLQVVKNTGWMIPYVACMMVVVGMGAHFLLTLTRFLRRRNSELAKDPSLEVAERQTRQQRKRLANEQAGRRIDWPGLAVPVAVVLLSGGWLASKSSVPKSGADDFNFYQFGQLPIVYEGRSKPVDTLARNSLQIVSGRQDYLDAQGKRQPAVRWLLDLITQPEVAFKHRVIRIENPDLRQTLKLDKVDEQLDQRLAEQRAKRRDPATKDDKAAAKTPDRKRESFLYSIDELQPELKALEQESSAARAIPAAEQTKYQKKLLELDRKVRLCAQLMSAYQAPQIRKDHREEDMQAAREQLQSVMTRPAPLAVPPANAEDRWLPLSVASLLAGLSHGSDRKPNPATLSWETILEDYGTDNARAFNAEVKDYQTWLAKHTPGDVNLSKVRYESFFNHFAPFFWTWMLDLLAFVLTCLAFLGWQKPLNRAAFWLLVLTFTVHTFGLVSRIYISGRPPVTNLYSSALFIGWGAMLLGLVLEAIYRLGMGNLVASVAGFATLLIAHFLSADGGDTFTVLQAVLDTQFWLATHVVCVTLGYATTFAAGLLGCNYIIAGTFSRSISPPVSRDISRMTYGILCFAIFFSFWGTVLGGLWADDSWGRFWGWDPKENGALIIVLWNALVLHARWGKLCGDRGLAALAVGGNIVTAWSWFGVNELGKGLHSYGFTDGVALTMGIFMVSQLLIIGLALMPLRWWQSTPFATSGPAGTA